jgi:hypothetical protein
MITEKTLIKFGLIKDEGNFQLKEIFKNNLKLKEVHIDIYPENPLVSSSAPFMLLLRTIEKDVAVSNEEDRLVLTRNDGYGTYFMNVLFSEIKECYCKDTYDSSEFILNIQNIWYRIIVFN